MHSRIRAYGVTLAALLALAVALPAGLAARPKPGVTPAGGFRLFARSLGAATVNRIYCGLLSTGKVCADSTNSSTIPGGFWPKGTGNQYVFNSGMQFGGQIAPAAANPVSFPWVGDTTGAFFFDARGDLSHGQEVQPIYNYASPADQASWPAAANVPQGDAAAGNFFPLLQGQPQASQGDIWFMTWDGDPAFNAGRKHPLGVVVETRMMGWNYPAGNNDILYLIYTFYNVSSTCAADYQNIRPAMKAILLQQAAVFQAKNNAAFGVTIPACGYDIDNFYANFAADMDVTPDAGHNYASVNLPYKMGYIYSSYFSQNSSATGYPADITGPPFMGGYGFVGVKYLASPDSGNGTPGHAFGPTGLTLFSDTENGGVFGDPGNAIQLYRYMSGTVTPALGDGQCNHNPTTSHICHVEVSLPNDMRFFEASGPFNLPAGAQGSVVVAYIFASPVKFGPCQTASPGAGIGPCGNLNPGDPEKLSNLDSLQNGTVNTVDHLTGFVSYSRGAEATPQQGNFNVVGGSLLGKANIAQLVFNNKFLLPFAPNAPDFFLVPGDNQVAIMWRPSTTEALGDLFYSVASSPVTKDSLGNPTSIPNPLYDPQYRFKDVEGYRVYRGRNQGDLHLLAQFDYAGTAIVDYNGVINPIPVCAPELAIDSAGIGADSTCNGRFTKFVPGTAQTSGDSIPLVGPIVQIVLHSGRVALANGTALVVTADTAVTGAASGKFPALADNGVPFTYVDHSALNNLRYFYAVTAFDLNSIQSGPSSLESPRVPKAVIPVHPASNWDNTGSLTISVIGRGKSVTGQFAAPTIDPANGTFSGPAQPATGTSLAFVGALVKQVVTQSGSMSYTLDSMHLGSSYFGGAGGASTPNTYFLSISSAAGTVHSALSVTQDQADAEQDISGNIDGGPIDPTMAAKYGGNSSYHLAAAYALKFPGAYFTGLYGRGCVNSAAGFTTSKCAYNGARWFDGPSPTKNETYPHPNRGNQVVGTASWPLTTASNGGSLTGVTTIYEPEAYSTVPSHYRDIQGAITGAATAADYNVYWGTTAGTIDSVVDITHNVIVPFDTTVKNGYTWGILDAASSGAAGSIDNRPGVATLGDFGCVAGIRGQVNGEINCTAAGNFELVNSVTPGPVALMTGDNTGTQAGIVGTVRTSAPLPDNGFLMYMPGHIYTFALAGGVAPSKPAVWTLRTYVGAISGGGGAVGAAGDLGTYTFTPQPSPLTAVGTSVSAAYTVVNKIAATTSASLDAIHTVPDPYYVTNGYEVSPTSKTIKFVNLPKQCTVRIYSTSGVLVRILDHNATGYGGSEDWDVRNRNNQVVASGVYFYSVESATGPRVVKRLTIVNFSQ